MATVPTRFPLIDAMLRMGNGRRGGGYPKTLRAKRRKNGGVTAGYRWVAATKAGEGGPMREPALGACTQGRWEQVGVSDPSKSGKSFEKQISG